MNNELYPIGRLGQVAEATRAAGLDALLLTPGPQLRYVTGYDAHQLERLTCLVVPAQGESFLVVPRLELPAAQAAGVARLGVELVPWQETDDPYAMVAARLGAAIGGVRRVGVADRMWAMMLLRLRAAAPGVEQVLAGPVLRGLRMRKSPAEVAALAEAGAAIDRVHEQVPGMLRPGRTEREIGTEIAAASGDVVVVDIGGTMPSGYCSDSTRTYALGPPPAEFSAYYQVLRGAQEAACAAARPGVSAEAVDATARDLIGEAGYGAFFIHRTGHGIGLETHEDPYIVAGNAEPLEPGMAFSVEPGIYPGGHGARIEDIVVCTEQGAARLNNSSRDLVIV